MELNLQSNNLKDYLKETRYVDFSNILIQEKMVQLFLNCNDDIKKVKIAYEFVRDEIPHSWEIKNKKISITASEVLKTGAGMCYEKSNLLAALLRSQGIPTGFCYQRLTLGETDENGYCIHALNGVYIAEINRWIRLDSRGNKPGVNAQFSLEKEQLAFPIRAKYDELDYSTIYTEPLKITISVLESNTDCIEMIERHLPTGI